MKFTIYILLFTVLFCLCLEHSKAHLIPVELCCEGDLKRKGKGMADPSLKEIFIISEDLKPETIISGMDELSKKTEMLMPPPITVNDDVMNKMGSEKAYRCSQLACQPEEQRSPVCACNYNTGNVASFKNTCDAKKHNCRFDTDFKVILDDFCPWEFASHRSNNVEFDYSGHKYYN